MDRLGRASLFSTQWHRVANVCPVLASDVVVARHVYRGRASYVLQRRAAGAVHHLDALSYALVDGLDGETSVSTLWERAVVEYDELAPTQDEWMELLSQLYKADLLVVDRRVPEERLFERRQDYRVRERKERYLNPLYLRFSLFDPDEWLDRWLPLGRLVFSREAAASLLFLLCLAVLTLFTHSDSLWRELTEWEPLSRESILLALALYPVLKVLHELAHALAVKRCGGEVHEIGVSLMVLLPLPYVDASASAMFPEKKNRMLVSAAGILVELAAAAIGVLLWVYADGLLQSLGMAMFVIGGLSTVVFNANPLLKFDGYYLLADWLEIPNLAERSRRKLRGSLRRLICGLDAESSSNNDSMENVCLHVYGICSALFRFVLVLTIAWIVSDQWFIIGLLLAAFALYTAVVRPLVKFAATLKTDTAFRSRRAVGILTIIPLAIVTVTCLIPLPHSGFTQGVVWVPDDAVVRADGDCQVTDIFVEPGEYVTEGQRLFVCEELGLFAQRDELIARVDELSTRRAGSATRDPLGTTAIEAELKASKVALSNVRERIANGTVSARTAGVFNPAVTASLDNHSFYRGDLVGYVVPSDQRTVRLAIREDWIDEFDYQLQSLWLRIPGADGSSKTFVTEVTRRTPKATRVVASPALTTLGGGHFPAEAHQGSILVKDAVFDLELEWPETAENSAIGSYVDVRLVYEPSTLASRMRTAVLYAFTNRAAS